MDSRTDSNAARAREQIYFRGHTPSGAPVWDRNEIEVVRRLAPNYAAATKRLGRRSREAVVKKAVELGLTNKHRFWTAADVSNLRRLYPRGTKEELRAAFPDRSTKNLKAAASRHHIQKAKRPYKRTGIPVIDQIRSRCFDLGYSMGDLDALARSKDYFRHGGFWRYLHHRAINRAILALDGSIQAKWADEVEEGC